MSLVARLLLLIALAILPVIGAQLYTQVELRHERAAAAHADATRYVRLVSSDADRVMEGAKSILIAVSQIPFIRTPDQTQCASYLQALAQRYPQVLNITLLDEHGTPICANMPILPGVTGADRFYFTEALRTNDFVIGDYIVGRTIHAPQLPLALPFTDDSGRRFVLSIGLNFAWLQDHFGDLNLPPGATVRIADRNGVVLVAPDDRALVGQPLPDTLQPARGPREGTFERRDRDGFTHIVGFEPLNVPPVGVVIAVDLAQRDIAAVARSRNNRDLIILLISTLIAAAIAWLGGRRLVSNPLRRLTATAGQWTEGDYRARARLADRRSEIGRLGLAFDRMADVIESNQQALQSLNETLEHRVAERTAALSEANRQLEASIAEREKIETALRQAQKMEAVGQLTGGIAHDFNNLLTVILGNLEIAAKRAEGQQDLLRSIVNAQRGGERAARLTRQLLAFSRQQTLQPTSVNLDRLISGMADFLQRTLGPSIEIETVMAAGLWQVSIDAGQLENAILNLCINARDAMKDGGRLTIETSNTYLDAAYAADHPEVTPGQYVMVAISDTGTGMPADVVARVFDPFFTTKPDGQGSGLGLSMVYGFVKQSSGHISVYSEPGQGTTFKLYLPRIEGHAATPQAATIVRSESGSGERILLVDDDDGVRDYTAAALANLGYRVTEATNAAEALAILRDDTPVDLLLTDVGLPGRNGRMLVEEARRIRPRLPVLFTTGYTRNAIVHHGILDAHVLLLPKPFTMAALADKVLEALESAGAPVACDAPRPDDQNSPLR